LRHFCVAFLLNENRLTSKYLPSFIIRLSMNSSHRLLLLLAVICCVEGKSKIDVHKVTVKDFKCKVSGVTAYTNFTCYAKSYSRTISTANMDVKFKRAITAMMVSLPIYLFSSSYFKLHSFSVQNKFGIQIWNDLSRSSEGSANQYLHFHEESFE